MDAPLVSVCIGAYNRKDYIRECIDSVLNQTWRNKEVIVVDDASTDGTREILESYGQSIYLILRNQNSGCCAVTRNEAIRASKGDFVAFLDSDDMWYPEKLSRQVDFFSTYSDIPLSHTWCNILDATSRVIGERHSIDVIPPTGETFEALLHHCWITISSVMVRRSIFEKIGLFNCVPPYSICDDLDFFLRISRFYKIGFIPEILTGYRKAGQGITAGNWKLGPQPIPLFQAFLKNKALWDGVVPRSRMRRALLEKCDNNAYFWRSNDQFSKAAWCAWQGIKASPFQPSGWKHLLASALHRK